MIPDQNKEVISEVTAPLLCAAGQQKSLLQPARLPTVARVRLQLSFSLQRCKIKCPAAPKKGVGADAHPEPPCQCWLDQSGAAELPPPRATLSAASLDAARGDRLNLQRLAEGNE